MAAPTNTVVTTTTVGIREDLEDVIYRVVPEKTTFISSIGKTKASATFHEWQTETLATPNANNAQYEGDDVTFGAGNQPARIGTTCQIFRKEGVISRTQDKVRTAGRDRETMRQKMLKGIELRRDMEIRMIGNYASVKTEVVGTTPRYTSGALAWLTSNTALGAGGANGGYANGNTTAATNGTTRAFTEALVKSVMALSFANGGEPSAAYVGPTHKQQFSAFTGIAQQRRETGNKMAVIIGAADVYVSDFGELNIVPHPYGLTRDCLLSDPEYWAVATLDGIGSEQLSKTGDSEKFMIIGEAALECKNEKAHAAIRDLA